MPVAAVGGPLAEFLAGAEVEQQDGAFEPRAVRGPRRERLSVRRNGERLDPDGERALLDDRADGVFFHGSSFTALRT